jgi:fluoroquinolone resistance protein
VPDATQDPPVEEQRFFRDDWYGEELAGRHYVRCDFHEVDFSEALTRNSVFTDCVFGNVRFNASRHTDSAFTGCAFKRCNFFDAEFTGCKLVGATFTECELRPLRVTGGDWSFAGLAGADLRSV